MKRSLSVIVSLLMLVALIGCSAPAPTASPAAATTPAESAAPESSAPAESATPEAPTEPAPVEPIPVLYLIPGDLPEKDGAALKAVNEKLAKDGVGIQLSIEAYGWDVWADKVNLKFTSNEEFDMFEIMQDWIPYYTYYQKGELVDVNPLVDQYGPVVRERIPQAMWDATRLKGANYMLPTYWIDLAIDAYIPYRKDAFEKFNLKVPDSPQAILDAFKTARAGWKGVNKPILNFSQATYDVSTLQLDQKIHPYYDRYPFIVRDGFYMITSDGKAESWLESPEFKQDCQFMNQAYKEGIIQPDILSVNFDWYNNYQSNGDWLMWTFTDLVTTLKNNPDMTADMVDSFLIAPSKPVLKVWGGCKNGNGISVTSKNPQGPVLFYNWLLTSQENSDMFVYGIKGTHWNTIPGPGEARSIKQVLDPATNLPLYNSGYGWMICYIDYIRYDTSGFMTYNDHAFVPNEKAINPPGGSFWFDVSNVANEYSNVRAVAAKVLTPIVMGVQDYDTYFPDALRQLKTAGLDTLIAEYQKQLAAAATAQN